MEEIKFNTLKELREFFEERQWGVEDAQVILKDSTVDSYSKMLIAIEYELEAVEFIDQHKHEEKIAELWSNNAFKTIILKNNLYPEIAQNLINQKQLELKGELLEEAPSVEAKLQLLNNLDKMPKKDTFYKADSIREYNNNNKDVLGFLKQENQLNKLELTLLDVASGNTPEEKLSLKEIEAYLEDPHFRRALFDYRNLNQYVEAQEIIGVEVLDILRDELKAKLGLSTIFEDIASRGEMVGTLEEFSLMRVNLENSVQQFLLRDFFSKRHYDPSSISLFQAALSVGLTPKVEISLKGEVLVYKYNQEDSALLSSFFNNFEEQVYSALNASPMSRQDQVAIASMFVGDKVKGAGANPTQSLSKMLSAGKDNRREELLEHVNKTFTSLEEASSSMPKIPGYRAFSMEKDEGKLLSIQAVVDDYKINLKEEKAGEFLCQVSGGENSFSDVNIGALFRKFTQNLNNYKEAQ